MHGVRLGSASFHRRWFFLLRIRPRVRFGRVRHGGVLACVLSRVGRIGAQARSRVSIKGLRRGKCCAIFWGSCWRRACGCATHEQDDARPTHFAHIRPRLLVPLRARWRGRHFAYVGFGIVFRTYRRRRFHGGAPVRIDRGSFCYCACRIATRQSHGGIQGMLAGNARSALAHAFHRRCLRPSFGHHHDHVLRRVRHAVPVLYRERLT